MAGAASLRWRGTSWTFTEAKEGEDRVLKMLKLRLKFDLHRDVVSDILRKEASVCRVKGEAFRCRPPDLSATPECVLKVPRFLFSAEPR